MFCFRSRCEIFFMKFGKDELINWVLILIIVDCRWSWVDYGLVGLLIKVGYFVGFD